MGKFSNNPMAGIVWDELTITLGALAADTSIQTASKIDAGRESGFRVLKTQYWLDVTGKTNDEGGILVGINHNLSVAENAEAIAADPQGHAGIARPENEQAMRPVWGLMFIPSTVVSVENKLIEPREVKLNWSFPEGSSMNWFAHAFGSLTTGTVVGVVAKHFGVWLKD